MATALVESFLRIQLKPNDAYSDVADAADDYQGELARRPGYIGSYVVAVEGIGGTQPWPFHIAIGFRGAEAAVNTVVGNIRNDRRVAEVRELRHPWQPKDEGSQD